MGEHDVDQLDQSPRHLQTLKFHRVLDVVEKRLRFQSLNSCIAVLNLR
jgi:hypothetical protein